MASATGTTPEDVLAVLKQVQQFHPPGVGSRMKLSWTRALLKAALTGALKETPFQTEPIFGLSVPQHCEGVPTEVLLPRNTWADKSAYDATANKLKAMIETEAKKYL